MKHNLPLPIYAPLYVALITAVFLPIINAIPGRDSGAFIYIAQQVLDGATPYRDVWDHKGPAIFYIDALGLYLSAGDVWGIWLLEVAALSLAGQLSFASLRHAYGTAAGLFGTALWMLSAIPVLDGGNLVELWALPLQFAALYLFASEPKCTAGMPLLWRTMLIGCLGGVAFLLRPNLIGVWIAIWICWIATNWRLGLLRTLYLVLAASAILGLISLYFASREAFLQMWDAVIIYNRAYASMASKWARIASVLSGIGLLASWPLVAAGWASALYTIALS